MSSWNSAPIIRQGPPIKLKNPEGLPARAQRTANTEEVTEMLSQSYDHGSGSMKRHLAFRQLAVAETVEGRSWMLRKDTLDDTLTKIASLLVNDDIWTASNAALIIARLTIEEEGCARILNRRDTRKLLLQLVNCLGIDDAGRGMNAAFAIGRLCDMESGRRHMLMLKKSDLMLSKLTEMLCSGDAGSNKNACFAFSCIAGSSDGVSRLLSHTANEKMLLRLASLLNTEDEETAWFAAMTLRTLSSKKQGCLALRDHQLVKGALKDTVKRVGLKDDIKEEIEVTLEMLKHLGKPTKPTVKIESSTTANVQWNAVNPKSGLEVTYKLLLFDPDESEVYCGLETSFELQNLQPTKNYSCKLQTSTEGDQSPISEAVAFSMPESVPSAPQNARVLGRTTTQMKIGWDPPESPNGIVKGFQIYQPGKAGFTETKDLSHIFINLIPSTEYTFEIYALTSVGKGDKADLVCATVDLREHAPPKPTLHALGRNEILVQWNPPEEPLGRINYYEVKMDDEVIYTGIDRTCTSRRLLPNTEYIFTVSAWTNEGRCESDPAKKRTAKEKRSFPREPLYPFGKRAKNGKPKQVASERNTSATSRSLQKHRSKSVTSTRPAKVVSDTFDRPKTSFQVSKNPIRQRASANLNVVEGFSVASTDPMRDRECKGDNSAKRRHYSTGNIQIEVPQVVPPAVSRTSIERQAMARRDRPSFKTRESLIGLGFRPGSIKKQSLRLSYSHNDTSNDLNNNGHPSESAARKSVSFSSPFSRALGDLQAIHLAEKTSHNSFQPSQLRTDPRAPIRSPNPVYSKQRAWTNPERSDRYRL
eukprot:Seg378.26 transcript_id=Seg378.26/GoldUCD/mRNA.D3Y31 product=Usherin protein_id=Seg378.26/GoldUCD/D3Y31